MKKRIAGIALTLVMLLSLGALTVQAATPAVYQVGYSKVDINPYFDENDHSKGLMPLPMAGNGFSDQRLSEPTKLDDTGDGKIDDRDGIFATCVAITDPSGNTMLIISADFCGSNAGLVTDLRIAIHKKYPSIDPTQIMYTASHTHSSIDLNCGGLSTEAAANLALYNERLRVNLLRMVDEALADRASATMYKGQIEANDSKAATGDIGDTINKYRPANDQVTVLPGEDYPDRVYNAVRHRAISIYPAQRNIYKKQSGNKIPYYSYPKDANKNYIADMTKEPITYIKGSNFNPTATLGGTSTIVYYADENGNKIADTKEEADAWSAKTGKTAYWLADVGVVADISRVTTADDTLLAWEFRFKDASRKPIVLINWRAHTTMNRYVSDDAEELKEQGKYQELGFYTSYYQISGDWVNAFRFVLEEEGYRAAFIQGAAGNITGGDGTWDGYVTETDRTHYRNNGNIYGTELAEVALECLREHMVQINVNGGDIRNKQIVYQTQKQEIEPGMFIAAHIYKAAYTPANPLGTRPYNVVYWLDANGDPLIDKSTGKSMVDDTTGQALIKTDSNGQPVLDAEGNTQLYTDKNGDPVVGVTRIAEVQKIASIHHANSVINKYKSTTLTGGQLELNAFMIGTQFAMVTAPNELFDRFSTEATMETIDLYNDWEKLWDMDTYGEPFMMGYANDSKGYISYQVAWDYTKGVLNWSGNDVYAEGSYETQVGWFKRGTGEELMDVYKWMLDTIDTTNETTQGITAYCQHCKKDALWRPYSESLENTIVLTSGHYYIDSDVIGEAGIRTTNNVCIDLRGRIVSTEVERAFSVNKGATLNIQDSVGGGTLIGTGYTGTGTHYGGVIHVDTGSTFNLYSGTLTNRIGEDRVISNGGVVYVAGTFNMYGGTIKDGTSQWAGGNIYIAAGATMNMSGGTVSGGKAEVSNTQCILCRGYFVLSGDANIARMRMWPEGSKPAQKDMLTVEGKFTGKAYVYVEGAKEGQDIGNLAEGASFTHENIGFNGGKFRVYALGSDIVLTNEKAAVILGENGIESYTDTLKEALEACQGTSKKAVLLKDNSEDIIITENVTLDLGGFNCTGKIDVQENITLTCLDSATDDYEGTYGTLTQATGTVKAAKNYRMCTEDTGVSFHAYSLDVTAAVLRPGAAGMFFTGTVKGDDQFKDSVTSYGIVLDATQKPTTATLNKTSKHTSYRDGFASTNGVTSVLLQNILKDENSWRDNLRNGDTTVYARAFIRFKDNSYAFSTVRSISFRELVEKADALWTEEAVPQNLQELYLRFEDTMKGWDVPNLKQAVKANAPSPYKVYKPMTVEQIDSLPIATADMTTDQLRQLCTDFFRMQNTFQWVLETDIRYDIRGKDTLLTAGTVYGGSPYTDTAKSGNLYMTMEFYDQQTGILRNPGMTDQEFMKLVGNHCTYGAFWGWARVINSMTAQFNWNMGLEGYGFIPLGDFSTAGIEKWVENEIDTSDITKAAGKEAILEGYAKVQQADVLYVWHGGNGNSHIRMAAQDAVVVRNADGSINPSESYILYLDQTSTWKNMIQDGIAVPVQGGVDAKVTFAKLYSGGYLPFTFGEFIGTDPVEQSSVDSTLEGLETVTPAQLSEAVVSSNYAISHVTLSVTDKKGKEVYRNNAFSPRILTMEMGIADAVDTETLTGLTGQHLTVTCRIGTGENVTLFSGTIA